MMQCRLFSHMPRSRTVSVSSHQDSSVAELFKIAMQWHRLRPRAKTQNMQVTACRGYHLTNATGNSPGHLATQSSPPGGANENTFSHDHDPLAILKVPHRVRLDSVMAHHSRLTVHPTEPRRSLIADS